MKYRKKPVVVEAMRVPHPHSANGFKLLDWLEEGKCDYYCDTSGLYISTLEGKMKANTGDWIIKGVKGEYYPCRDDVFQETYERTGYE